MRTTFIAVVCLLASAFPVVCSAQSDKAIHSAAGFGITITISSITNKPKLGLLAGIGAGVGKELWDASRPKHDASAADCVSAVAASSAAYVLWRYALDRPHRAKVAKVETLPKAAAPLPTTTATPQPATAAGSGTLE